MLPCFLTVIFDCPAKRTCVHQMANTGIVGYPETAPITCGTSKRRSYNQFIGFGVTAARMSPKRRKFEKTTSNGGFFHSSRDSGDQCRQLATVDLLRRVL